MYIYMYIYTFIYICKHILIYFKMHICILIYIREPHMQTVYNTQSNTHTYALCNPRMSVFTQCHDSSAPLHIAALVIVSLIARTHTHTHTRVPTERWCAHSAMTHRPLFTQQIS